MDGGVRPSKTSPKYLEANATSHTWIFSAIAELIDNAYDPDVNAKQIHIDFEKINGYECLTFTDDGYGMDKEKLFNMLSFGYSDKVEFDERKPIGRYGNGFKSGSMRLGKDALVLTRQADTMSVGLLSRTYLKQIEAETILIPIVSFDIKTKTLLNPSAMHADLHAILRYSMLDDVDDLLFHLSNVAVPLKSKSGTKVIIYNLKTSEDSTGELELKADLVNKDIMLNANLQQDGDADYRRSLRTYCRILYLKPRMKIFIMGKKVAQRLIAKDLSKTETDYYKPTWVPRKIPISIGFNPKSCDQGKNEYGVMIYNKNRLITAYEKVGYQKQPNEMGVGVVAVLEVDFLTPIHNKQSFNMDSKYSRLYSSLASKMNEYWDTKMKTESAVRDKAAATLEPDCNWVMCDNCLKWRRLLPGQPKPSEDDVWYCHMNMDVLYNQCGIQAEVLEVDEVDVPGRVSYKEQKQRKRRSVNAEASKRRSSLQVTEEVRLAAAEEIAAARRDEREKNLREVQQQREKAERAVQKEREKLKRRLAQDKDYRKESRQAWAIVDRNLRDLRRQTLSMFAGLNANVEDVVEQVHHDAAGVDEEDGRLVICTICHCWRILPHNGESDLAVDQWTCAMHPNSKIRESCQVEEEAVKPKKPKIEIQEVDLTLEDGETVIKVEEDTESENYERSQEADEVNAVQNELVDLRCKLNRLSRVCVKVKAEKVERDAQTDVSMAYSPESLLRNGAPENDWSKLKEENDTLRAYTLEMLQLLAPGSQFEPGKIVDTLKSLVEDMRNSTDE